LKRLFAEGMRPRYVLVGLSPNQLASTSTRGDYSARYLFQREDLVDVARKTHMDATTATGFLLSHFSKYYSTRAVTRGFLLGRLLPSVDESLHNSRGMSRDAEVQEAALRQLVAERLAASDQLCRANGSRFMLVVPPSYQKGAETIAQIGRDVRVTVLVPLANSEIDSRSYQRDGLHLNDEGARLFTVRLAANLLAELTQ
jgi:hypothetical protein